MLLALVTRSHMIIINQIRSLPFQQVSGFSPPNRVRCRLLSTVHKACYWPHVLSTCTFSRHPHHPGLHQCHRSPPGWVLCSPHPSHHRALAHAALSTGSCLASSPSHKLPLILRDGNTLSSTMKPSPPTSHLPSANAQVPASSGSWLLSPAKSHLAPARKGVWEL